MLIGKFNKAIKQKNLTTAKELGVKILSSPTPYPRTLQQYVLELLKQCPMDEALAEIINEINPESERLISLVEENNWLFDDSYYTKQTATLFPRRSDAILHYINEGWKRGYDPTRFFSTSYYLGYPDIAASGICPLVHYLEHGIHEKRGTSDPFSAMHRSADLIEVKNQSISSLNGIRIGVFLHLYYIDLSEIIIQYLNNIPYPYDLYISTQAEHKTHAYNTFRSLCIKLRDLHIECFENKGRDVAPFISGFGNSISNYELILKLHSKKSPHEKHLSTWLEHILENLLGNEDIIYTIINEIKENNTKLIYPVETLNILYGVAKDSCWGHNPNNFTKAEPILQKWNVRSNRKAEFKFPAGTMFWSQSSIFKPLIDLNLSFSDFDEEQGQIDGTLAHAIERLIGISATELFNGDIKTSFLSWNQGEHGKKLLANQIRHYPISISGFEKVYHFNKCELDQSLIRQPIIENSLDIHWVIPDFLLGAGGHMTIFRAISYLEKCGHSCTIWIHSLRRDDQDHVPSTKHRLLICNHFINLKARVFLLGGDSSCLDRISGDMVIATDRMSAYPVLSMKNFLARGYFIQDFEPSFFATGSESLLTELTYSASNSLTCICASAWLAKVMKEKYGNDSFYFPLAVDHNVYKACEPDKKVYGQIAFYVRRSTPRRLFAIGLLALHELFALGARFSLVVFGEEDTPSLNLPIHTRYLGILTGKELRDVYAESYIGLVLSGTNYSLIPNEMMAVGLPVVDIDGEHTRLSYSKDTVILAEPDPKCIAKELKKLLDDKVHWKKCFNDGIEATSTLTWDNSFSSVNAAITETCVTNFHSYPNKLPSEIGSPLVTVVIPAYNGGELLRECVQAVLRQNTSFLFDVLVIDSSSSDGSIDAIRGIPRVFIHEIPSSEFGHGKTRNLGARLARGEFVAYLTQDAIPANSFWLQNLVDPMIYDPDIAGVLGAHIAHIDHSPLIDMDLTNHFYSWLSESHATPIQLDLMNQDRPLGDHERFYSDNNSCLRKTVWELHPYSDVVYGEDQLWAELILKAGFKKAFAPMSIVFHSHEYGFRQTLIRANTEWHFFDKYLNKKLPHSKEDVRHMLKQSVRADMSTSKNLDISSDRTLTHFARAAGYYLAGKGYGYIRP